MARCTGCGDMRPATATDGATMSLAVATRLAGVLSEVTAGEPPVEAKVVDVVDDVDGVDDLSCDCGSGLGGGGGVWAGLPNRSLGAAPLPGAAGAVVYSGGVWMLLPGSPPKLSVL